MSRPNHRAQQEIYRKSETISTAIQEHFVSLPLARNVKVLGHTGDLKNLHPGLGAMIRKKEQAGNEGKQINAALRFVLGSEYLLLRIVYCERKECVGWAALSCNT